MAAILNPVPQCDSPRKTSGQRPVEAGSHEQMPSWLAGTNSGQALRETASSAEDVRQPRTRKWTYRNLVSHARDHDVFRLYDPKHRLHELGVNAKTFEEIVASSGEKLGAACLGLYGESLLNQGFVLGSLIAVAKARGGGHALEVLNEEWPVFRQANFIRQQAITVARSLCGAEKMRLLSLHQPELQQARVTAPEQTCATVSGQKTLKGLSLWIETRTKDRFPPASRDERIALLQAGPSIDHSMACSDDAYNMIKAAVGKLTPALDLYDVTPVFERLGLPQETSKAISVSPGGPLSAVGLAIFGEALVSKQFPITLLVRIAKTNGGGSTLASVARNADFLFAAGFTVELISEITKKIGCSVKLDVLAAHPASQVKEKILPLLNKSLSRFTMSSTNFQTWLENYLR
jgi:hypothetical protein